MIKFINTSQEIPYQILKDNYKKAKDANQKNIEAVCIASYSDYNKEVNSRFVNLKIIDKKEFIFFSNYRSLKSQDFQSHEQISALFFWNSIDVQIRIKAKINQTTSDYNQEYFSKRNIKKNALAICSDQSKHIDSYEELEKKYNKCLENNDLQKCPEYWGGFSFTPYYFEFWHGHKSRLNKREIYELVNNDWIHSFLQA
jgi:pyridoxamine 5'-phosphate oxidase